jgi:putative endonuclease
MKADNKKLGAQAEDLAAEFLVKHGYIILERNFRNAIGEIDIVAIKPNSWLQHLTPKKILKTSRLIFVEVKAQSGTRFGMAEERIGFFKQQKLRQLASAYLKEKNLINQKFQIDAIRVDLSQTPPIIKHIVSAVES